MSDSYNTCLHIYDAANSDELDEKEKCPVVQQKGRFKVTSENVDVEKVSIWVSMSLILFIIGSD